MKRPSWTVHNDEDYTKPDGTKGRRQSGIPLNTTMTDSDFVLYQFATYAGAVVVLAVIAAIVLTIVL